MREIVTKFGRNLVILIITLISIALSMLITYLVLELTNSSQKPTAMMISVLAPLIIAPLVSWHIVGLLFEIDQLEIKMHKLAMTDELTGLRNRHALFLLAEQRLDYAKRYQRIVSLLLIDVDYFKQINDKHGHLAGDEVLRHLAKLVKGFIRKSDIIGRLGGDEFLIMLPETDKQNALIYAEKLRRRIQQKTVAFNDSSIGMTVSIGVSTFESDADINRIEDLLHQADTALYQAKRKGRNQIVSFPFL
jgi:diguanylate cyclase (GGDEF)-like protein